MKSDRVQFFVQCNITNNSEVRMRLFQKLMKVPPMHWVNHVNSLAPLICQQLKFHQLAKLAAIFN